MKNKIKYIKNKEDFLSFIEELKKDSKKYIFRGQSNTNLNANGELSSFKPWVLESSLKRKFKKERIYDDYDFLAQESENLVSFIEIKSKFKTEKLEILSEIHHSGMPTFLIEFTEKFNEALFFGFDIENFSSSNNGYVTIFKKEVSSIEKFKHSLKNVWELNFIYEYLDNSKTVLPKQSLFILDNDKDLMNDIEIIKIDYKLTKFILDFLKKENINNETIFPDFKGYYKEFFNENENFNLLKATSFYKIGRYYEAIEKCKKAIEINPDNFKGYNEWGNILIKLAKKNFLFNLTKKTSLKNSEKYNEAIAKYKHSIKINPLYFETYFNLGNALFYSKDYKEAIEKYTIAKNKHDELMEINNEEMKIDSKHFKTFLNWGKALYSLGDYKEAIEKYEKAIEINLEKKHLFIKLKIKIIKKSKIKN